MLLGVPPAVAGTSLALEPLGFNDGLLMLRISKVVDDGRITLRLEGRLLEPWVEALTAECAGLDGDRRQHVLDLSAVTFLDAAGVRAVRELTGRSLKLIGCSGFISELLGAGQDGHD
jgi:hypothetical protein